MSMLLIKRGGSSKDRRKARRYLERMGASVPSCLASISPVATVIKPVAAKVEFTVGQQVRLISELYGKTYFGRTVTILEINGSEAVVQLPKRKSPFKVQIDDLEIRPVA